MAIFDGKFLKGILGDFIFKVVDGIQVVSKRPVPGTMKQTVETKNASENFRKSSMLGKHIRGIFHNTNGGLNETSYAFRFTSALTTVLTACDNPIKTGYLFKRNSFGNLAGFEFNIKSPVKRILNLKPKIELNQGIMKIVYSESGNTPKLRFPKHATQCKLTFVVGLIRLKDGKRILNPEKYSITLKKNEELINLIDFSFKIPDGCLSIAVMFLSFYNGITLLNSKSFNPAVICDAILSPGTFTNQDNHSWMEMPGLNFG